LQKNTCNNNGSYGIQLWISTTNSTVNDNECLGNATCDIIADPSGSGNTEMNNTASCIMGF
ncbi:MAG: hypothetical protein KDC44_04925, partial [Phaeodactylibacter sp.]|nr:hypothetical protein [Phaeodactylibacter sp.]